MERKLLQDRTELGRLKNFLFSEIEDDGERIRRCLQFTFLLGLVAHGYGFLNFTINHDSLTEFYGLYEQKVAVGRFLVPLWRQLMGDVMVSVWLNGLLSLLFIGLGVHLISKMFSLNKVWENLVLAGICVTNVTVTCLAATYLHDLSGDMLALPLSVAAAYLWSKMDERFSLKCFITGGILLAMSLGFYQAFAAVMVSLVCIYTALLLLRGEDVKHVLFRVAIAVGMFALSVVLYFCMANLALKYYSTQFLDTGGTSIASINENLRKILGYSFVGYRNVLRELFAPNMGRAQAVFDWQAKIVCLFNGALFIKMLWILYTWIKKKAKSVTHIIFALMALALLPLCMSCIVIISTETNNRLRYAYYLYYLLVLVLFRYAREEKLEKNQSGRNWRQSLRSVRLSSAMFRYPT